MNWDALVRSSIVMGICLGLAALIMLMVFTIEWLAVPIVIIALWIFTYLDMKNRIDRSEKP